MDKRFHISVNDSGLYYIITDHNGKKVELDKVVNYLNNQNDKTKYGITL
jgi:hypothetical protein